MSAFGYRAAILRDHSDWMTNTVRLMVANRQGTVTAYLRADGAWQTVEEGAVLTDDMGLRLPAESVEAIAVALQEYQGHTSHADTEARVLREWLAAERQRVDAVLGGRA